MICKVKLKIWMKSLEVQQQLDNLSQKANEFAEIAQAIESQNGKIDVCINDLGGLKNEYENISANVKNIIREI